MTRDEFKSMILPSKDKLFRIALSLLGNREEAEDTLQDVYLKLWGIRERLAEYRNVEALAVTATRNLCLDKLRSYRHRYRNEKEIETMPIRSETPDPVRSIELKESLQKIHEIFESLPEQQRLIIHLRDVEHYEYNEIKKFTGMTLNNIRVNLSRARKTVREEYHKQQDYGHSKN